MLFVSGVFTPKRNLSSIDEYTIGSYQIHVFWWLIQFMFGVKIPKLAGWGEKRKTGHKTMEREHAVITQIWDYWKQCEDIVIVSKHEKLFLAISIDRTWGDQKKTIAPFFHFVFVLHNANRLSFILCIYGIFGDYELGNTTKFASKQREIPSKSVFDHPLGLSQRYGKSI